MVGIGLNMGTALIDYWHINEAINWTWIPILYITINSFWKRNLCFLKSWHILYKIQWILYITLAILNPQFYQRQFRWYSQNCTRPIVLLRNKATWESRKCSSAPKFHLGDLELSLKTGNLQQTCGCGESNICALKKCKSPELWKYLMPFTTIFISDERVKKRNRLIPLQSILHHNRCYWLKKYSYSSVIQLMYKIIFL